VEHPRRAAVSAFGFGGTNFHAVLEQHVTPSVPLSAACEGWRTELLAWTRHSREQLVSDLHLLQQELNTASPKLSDLSLSLWEDVKRQTETNSTTARLAIVADSLEDLRTKLHLAATQLQASASQTLGDPRGLYFVEGGKINSGEVAFLFPGQGSQYPGMLGDLAIHFAEVREQFEMADRVLSCAISNGLSRYVFPPPSFTSEEQSDREEALKQTNIAQPALGAADLAMFRLLRSFGISPHFVAGHSYGEYVALCAARVFPEDVLLRLSEVRGQIILGAAGRGSMASVSADRGTVETLLTGSPNIWIANINSPCQTIVAGTPEALQSFAQRAGDKGLCVRPVAVSCAFHSPMMGPARDRLLEELSAINFCEPRVQAFSNTLADRYPLDGNRVAELLADHLVRPVDFAGEIEAMYAAGARVFVEVGPRNVLTKLTDDILQNRAHLSVATDVMGRSGLLQLQHALGQLFANGSDLSLDALFLGRTLRRFELGMLAEQTRAPALSSTTWLVNGGRARPAVDVHSQGQIPAADRQNHVRRMKKNSGPETARNASMLVAEANNPERKDSLLDGSRTSQPFTSARSASKVAEDSAGVMLRFNSLMQQFLETQQRIMLAYLEGRSPVVETAALSNENIGRGTEKRGSLQEPIAQRPTTVGQGSHAALLDQYQRNAESTPRVAEASDAFSVKTVTTELLKIVSQRTGYPSDMLSLDRDIESDLGIDSIKRTEILAAFQSESWPADRVKPEGLMESLTRMKTIGGIIDRIVSELQVPSKEPTLVPIGGAPDVPRFRVEYVIRPANRSNNRIPSSVIIVVDDGRRLSTAVISELTARKIGAVLLTNHLNGELPGKCYHADFRDPLSIEAVIREIRRERGPISGVIHLPTLTLRTTEEINSLGEWREHLAAEAKSLFYLTKAAGSELRESARIGCSWLASAVTQDAVFGGTHARILPSEGAIRGFIKSAAAEWPEVLCKVIALDLARPVAAIAAEFVDELVAGDNDVEVGFSSEGRSVLRASPIPLINARASSFTIDAESVVLVTGGARGIAAEAAHQLAKYRPTLLLMGRAAFPETDESDETSRYRSPAELKSWLIKNAHDGEGHTPVQIDAACRRILQEREMRDSVARMSGIGATTRYFQADGRDEEAVKNVVKQIYCDYGRLDGVIHAAGIIEDNLIEHKSYDSFDRVFSTKLDTAFALSRAIDTNALKFFAFFSSISGTFGNRGQVDYAAANAALDQFAEHLDKKWPCRVVSIAWGPWDRVGMVSERVRKQFDQRGVQIISRHEGAQAFERELLYGRKGEVCVVLGGGPWQIADVVPRMPHTYRAPQQLQEQAVMSAD
jgi:acyl transferase domain-containing protein